MSVQHRNFHFGQKGNPLKQRKSPLSLVVENDWFPSAPVLKIIYRGGGSKLTSYILNSSPNLPLDVVIRLDHGARYSAIVNGVTATSIIDLFLANSNSIWDFRSKNLSFTNAAATTKVTANGDDVQVIKPLTGTNNLTLTSGNTPAKYDERLGLLYLNDPVSEYRIATTFTGKTFFYCNTPAPYSSGPDPNMNYPFSLATWDTNVYDFHPGLAVDSTYFSEQFAPKCYYANLWLNGVSTTGASLTRIYTPNLITISATGTETLQFNSVSSDRINVVGQARHFTGYYRFLMAYADTYTTQQINALNSLCLVYAGLI